MTRIRVRDARQAEAGQALQVALAAPGMQAHHAQGLCQATQQFLTRCGGRIGGLHVAEADGRIAVACAALDLPGGATLLMCSPGAVGRDESVLGELLARACQGAAQRDRRFAQIMLEPTAAEPVSPALARAGFEYLARLQYLRRGAFDPAPSSAAQPVRWVTLADSGTDAFAEVIRRTYIDSRDCPALTGVRTMDEVLDSHRGAGDYDPTGWYLLCEGEARLGVLITARTPMRPTLELVYVGLVPEARGRGLGRFCVHHAIRRARDLALPQVTLAVDADNEPARRTYAAMGFAQYMDKDVWIRVLRRAADEDPSALPLR